MNTFKHVKTGDIESGGVFSFDFAPERNVRLFGIQLSARNSAEVDVYLGNAAELNRIFSFALSESAPNFVMPFIPPVLITPNELTRVIMRNTHSAALPISVTLGFC